MVFKNKITEEERWIKRCIKGERYYFRYIVERYERMIRTIIYRLINNAYDVDELAQETFITAYERLPQFSGKSQFSTWLCQIALNKARDFLRTNKRRHDEEMAEVDANLRDHGGMPEELVSNQEKTTQLNAALHKLKQDDRELIIFKYIYGYSYEAIAEILTCTPEAAKVRSLRARKSLKKILLRMGVTP